MSFFAPFSIRVSQVKVCSAVDYVDLNLRVTIDEAQSAHHLA